MADRMTARLKFKVFSLADFTDRTLIERVLDILDAVPCGFRPERYGYYEPVTQVYQHASRAELVACWRNEAPDRVNDKPRSGVLCLEASGRLKAEYFVAWEKDRAARFNLMTGRATVQGDGHSGELHDFVELTTAIVLLPTHRSP